MVLFAGKLRTVFLSALVTLICLLMIGCVGPTELETIIVIDEPLMTAAPSQAPSTIATIALSATQSIQAATQTSMTEDTGGKQTVRIRAVGDLMMHDRQLKSARTETGFDFSKYFACIADEIKIADIAIGNLEAPVGTENFSGYPRFKAPTEYLQAIKDAGFDAVSLANNHIFDHGITGLESTTEQLRAYGFLYAGAGSSQELSAPLILEKNGIRVALLAYAQSTNLRSKSTEGRIKTLQKETIAGDVQLAKQSGADFIIAFIHWGSEYTDTPSSYQKQWAQTLADSGVDAILGSHPHVLQPIATIKAADGRDVFCAYSMGNFMSNQPDFPRYIGTIIELTIEKDSASGQCVLRQSGFIPTWICRTMRKGGCDYQVLRSNVVVQFEDEKLTKWAAKRAEGALKHAVEVLGANGAQMLY